MKTRRSRRSSGFTLIEVLLVLTILVVLMSMVVGGFMAAQKQSNRDAAKTQIGLFDTPLKMYHLKIGSYPTTEQGLEALVNAPSDLPNPDKWGPEPYLEKAVPPDPWGKPYQYECPGKNNPNGYDLWTEDPEGEIIGNWSEEQNS